MVPREGKERKLELRLQRTASIRGSGWGSEGTLRAAVASPPIVGRVLALDFHPSSEAPSLPLIFPHCMRQRCWENLSFTGSSVRSRSQCDASVLLWSGPRALPHPASTSQWRHHRSLPFMGVWRDHSEECEIKGDVEKETGEKWPHFRQGVRAQCLRDNGMETVSRFKDNLLGPTRVVRRDWEEGSFTSEFNPVQQNMLGVLAKYNMLSATRGYKGTLTSWGPQITWESEESYRPLETSLHTVSEGIPHFWNSSVSSTPALYENLQVWDSAESCQGW